MKAARLQRGAVSVLVPFFVIMSISTMAVLAAGQVLWEQARLQNLVDQVALTAIRQKDDAPTFAAARQVALLNGLKDTDTLTIQCIANGAVTNNCESAITVRATITRDFPGLFFVNPDPVTRLAEATHAPVVSAMVDSNLLNLDSSQSALLNGLLTAVGAGNINLSVAQYQQLLGANLAVNLLQLGLELGVVSVDQLANVNITALQLLQESLALAQGDAASKAAFSGVLGALAGPLNAVTLNLSDILALNLAPGNPESPSEYVAVNVGQLAHAALLRTVQGKSHKINVTSGLLGVDVTATVLQPPQVFVGRQWPGQNPIAQGKTAQVALAIEAKQNFNLVVATTQVKAEIQLRVAGGLAQVDDLTCRIPRENNTTTVTVVPALAELCVSDGASNLTTTVGALSCGNPGSMVKVTLLGIPVEVQALAAASARANPSTFTLDGPAPPMLQTGPVNLSAGQTLQNLLGNLDVQLSLKLPVVGPLIQPLLQPLLNTLVATLDGILSPFLGAVGTILDNLLNALGVSLNQVNVAVHSVDCSKVHLSR